MSASAWDIISSTLFLVIFLGAVFVAIKVARAVSTSSAKTQSDLRQKGVTYQSGRLSLKTDRAAPSREEYIAQTKRAFEKGAKQMSLHPEAFRTGPSRENSAEPARNGTSRSSSASGRSSAVETSEKKGFQRGKKLA